MPSGAPNKSCMTVRQPCGVAALIAAATHGHLQTVRTLLQQGARPDLCMDDGMSALIAASSPGYVEIVHALCAAEGGSSALVSHAMRDNGATALHAAPILASAAARSAQDALASNTDSA